MTFFTIAVNVGRDVNENGENSTRIPTLFTEINSMADKVLDIILHICGIVSYGMLDTLGLLSH